MRRRATLWLVSPAVRNLVQVRPGGCRKEFGCISAPSSLSRSTISSGPDHLAHGQDSGTVNLRVTLVCAPPFIILCSEVT